MTADRLRSSFGSEVPLFTREDPIWIMVTKEGTPMSFFAEITQPDPSLCTLAYVVRSADGEVVIVLLGSDASEAAIEWVERGYDVDETQMPDPYLWTGPKIRSLSAAKGWGS